MIDETVPVLRDGREQEVPTAQIVTGDLLVLRAGVQVAADARLVQQDGLQVDESTLTGESRFVAKSIAPMTHAAPLADRTNMLYMGTAIAAGIGLAVVVATGSRSELGRIQHMVDNTLPPPTPIQRQLDALGNQLVRISTAACVLVFGIGLVRGRGALIMLKASMSLAIAAVPEGLPTVATTAFARGLRIMRAQQMLIRRLKTIETLGAVQTVCFDKTGTLTLNRMSAVALQTPSYRCAAADGCRLLPEGAIRSGLPEEVIRLLEVCVLSRENGAGAQQQPTLSNGSATENALQRMAIDAGIDATQVQVRYPLLHSLLRSERRKYMMTVHAASKSDDESNDDMRLPAHGSHWLAVKGAPLEVLALCSRMHDGARLVLLTPALRAQIVAANADMAARQLRVLGFAWGDVAVASTNIDTDTDTDADDAARSAPHDLVWLGLVGLADPIRPGITEVIRDFHRAGIRTVMITGDQRATAQAVGEQLGLADGRRLQVLDADEFDRIDAALLPARVAGTDVFARVSPGHKLQIVQALQHDGTVVAMTGDGINDGPALRAADVGIAMGLQGTDLARGAAGVVLKDDRLDTLLDAIRQGRTITRNIEKSLEFLISSNLSEILIVLGAIGITASAPLTPIQLLWINLLSDVWPAVALAAEPPDGDVMAQPPRDPRRPLVGREALLRHAREAGWLTAGTLGVYLYAVLRHGAGARASAMMFNAMILGQMLHALSCRSRRPVSLLPRQGRDGAAGMLDRAVTGSVAVQIGANLLPGLSRFLGLGQRIDLVDAAAILGGALLPFVANQVAKADVADSDACPPVGTGPRAVCDGSLSRPGPARSC
jgi:Ca2+-transporting ATPase